MKSKVPDCITAAQLAALQSLYAAVAASTFETGDPRTARLEWASQNIGRTIASFKKLTKDEARRLIDVLKVSLGQEINVRPFKREYSLARSGEGGRDGWTPERQLKCNFHGAAGRYRADRARDRAPRLESRSLQ